MSADEHLSSTQFREVRDLPGAAWAPMGTNSVRNQKVRLDNIIATQSGYNPARVEEYKSGTAEIDHNISSPGVKVYRSRNNRNYVMEGHHRVIAAKGKGATHIEADVHAWVGST